MQSIQDLLSRIDRLEEAQRNSEYQFQQTVSSDYKRRQRTEIQPEDLLGLHTAVVVDTVDPLKQGRVRFYSPYLSERTTADEGMPWASPVSPFGGFDDSGCIWVPPAGSKIVIFFDNGNLNSAYYFGTIWHRHRGSDGNHLPFWDNHPIPEYACLWDGRRNGYLFGDNTGDQVLPPWNTEMYNGYDNDSITDFYNDPQQYNLVTYPYIKGFKTEQKHYLKFVDGDPRCNRRWTRVEFASGRGNFLVFKDDHLHPAGQWAFGSGGEKCHEDHPREDFPLENPCCDDDEVEIQKCLPTQCGPVKECPEGSTSTTAQGRFKNPFFKRREEMRFYSGPNTPQANRCTLDQSGVHMQSISGHQMVMDDSVDQPTGVPTWDREFDFGCNDTYRGKMFMRSATGHIFEISDEENPINPKVRGEENYIGMRTATGNFFEMNDHTLPDNICEQKIAGKRRGFTMMSTSTHLFQMNDHRLEQSSPIRRAGGSPKKHDKPGFKGYCLLRSGYGLQLLMRDADRQDKTVSQFIQLMAPQIDNKRRGPHMLVMQERPSGPGFVLLRAGGIYFLSTYDESIEVVGEEGENPSSKFVTVTDSYMVDVKNMYFNHNDTTIFFAEKFIYLMAGRDCPPPPEDADSAAGDATAAQDADVAAAIAQAGTAAGKSDDECGPCLYNVIVAKDPWVCPLVLQSMGIAVVHYGTIAEETDTGTKIILNSKSERVFASAKNPTGTEACTHGKPNESVDNG